MKRIFNGPIEKEQLTILLPSQTDKGAKESSIDHSLVVET